MSSSSATWTEPAITWKNKPASGVTLATAKISGTAQKWYEIDLTTFLKTEKAAGRNTVSLVLKSQTATSTVCSFGSDEVSAGPQLVIVP